MWDATKMEYWKKELYLDRLHYNDIFVLLNVDLRLLYVDVWTNYDKFVSQNLLLLHTPVSY